MEQVLVKPVFDCVCSELEHNAMRSLVYPCSVQAGPYKMVASVGWNPFFDNKTKTVEPHLLHEFPSDFYGAEIRVVMTGV